jgi:hypothetical protein
MRSKTKACLVGITMLLSSSSALACFTPSNASTPCNAGRDALAPLSGYSWGSRLESARAGTAHDCGEVQVFAREAKQFVLSTARNGGR